MGLSINKDNYSLYKRVALIVLEEMETEAPVRIELKYQPMAVLESFEKHSAALARRGLQEGLRDSVVELRYCSPSTLERMDVRLKSEGLPGVLMLMSIANDTLKKVLKRGGIRTVEEFYVVKDRLDDFTFSMTESDRSVLNKAMDDFEHRRPKSSKKAV